MVKNNSIYSCNNTQIINLAEMHRGIWVKNSKDCEVSLNTISRSNPNPANNGTLALTSYLRGITVELSPESYVHDNNMQQMGYGMRWVGSSMNSTISCNIMEKCYNGVFFDNAEIGNQGGNGNPSGNYWVTNQDPVGKMDGALNALAPQTYWWADYGLLTNPNIHSVNTVNFTTNSTTGPANCQITPGGGFPGPMNPQKREAMFGAIVRDEKQFLVFYDETRQLNRRYLYQSLKNNPGWISLGGSDDADYQTFFNTVSLENEGIIENVTELISDTNYIAANTLNQTIITTLVPETNQKTVNEIYLATWANDIEIDTNQFMILEGIACQDPIEGGSAVYGARILIGLDYECGNGANKSSFEGSGQEDQIVEESDLFALYPNPSNGVFTLSNQGESVINGQFQVFDVTGKMIITLPVLADSDNILDLSQLPDGMYHYLIYSADNLIFSNKFVISK